MTEQGTALATPALINEPARLDASDHEMLWKQAEIAIKSGLLPRSLNKPEQVFIIMAKGRELGISPQYALNNIAVIEGKPTIGAELMLALIYSRHGDDAVRFKEKNRTRCTIRYKRRTWQDYDEYSFDMEDAKLANLTGKTNWKNYPAAMLRARCISAVARMAFPDCIAGFYTPEELGADVEVDETGQTMSVLPVANDGPVEASENVLVDAERAEAMPEMAQAIMDLADFKESDPVREFTRACVALKLPARKSGDLTTPQIYKVRDWALKEMEPEDSAQPEEPQPEPEDLLI